MPRTSTSSCAGACGRWRAPTGPANAPRPRARARRSASSRCSPARARSASVQAVRDSTLLQLGRGRFVELMERDPRFAAAVARELAAQLQASGGLAAPPTRPALLALRRLDPGVPLAAVASSLARALVDVRAGRGARGGRRRHERGRAGRGRERPRAARRRGGRRRLERPLRAPGRPDAAGRDGGQPAVRPSASPDADLVVLGPSSGDSAPRAPRRRPAARPPPARDDRAERPGRRPARAATRRARARRRPLRRRRARLRAHRRARRARGRRDRGRPLRRLLDGLVHRGDGRRRLERAATSATAATRSSCGARRSTTTRSRGSR